MAIEWATSLEFKELAALLGANPFVLLLWTWKYEQSPESRRRGRSWVALAADGVPIAFCGLMPVRVRMDGEPVDGQWSVDLFVHPEWRGQGMTHRLYARVESMVPVSMGLGTAEGVYGLKLRRGWSTQTGVRHFVKIRRRERLRDQVRFLLQSLRQTFASDSLFNPAWRVNSSADFDVAETDALWHEFAGGYRRAVIRDGPYLDWRYRQHPARPYRYLLVRDRRGKLRAWAAFREDGTKACLVDYVGPAIATDLKRRILRRLERNCPDVPKLVCTTSCPDWQRALAQEGYLAYHEPERFTVFASAATWPDPAGDWFVMGGDSDGDAIDAASALVDASASAVRG